MLPCSDLLQEVHGEEPHFAAGVDFHVTVHLLTFLHHDLGGGKGVWVRCVGPGQQGKGVTPRKRGTTERVQYRGLGEIDIGGGGQLMKGGWGRDGGAQKALVVTTWSCLT